MAKLSKTIDMMLGIHLDAHVQGERDAPSYVIVSSVRLRLLA